MAKIRLSKGKFALVDDADVELVSKYSWHYDGNYAISSVKIDGKRKVIRMHRLLCDGDLIDHINGNKIDNRRANLRSVTKGQNRQNARGSGRLLQGVYKHSETNRFYASINVNGQTIYLGMFEYLIDAAKAYDDAARLHYGEHAVTNSEKLKKLFLPK